MSGTYQVIHADCMNALRDMAEQSVDAVVTDPPYHLTSSKGVTKGFMGKEWDGGDIAFTIDLWREVLRVLKPGGYLLAFGGTRTSHRMVCAIEDAGFECRDSIIWMYATGFPKSHNLSGDLSGRGSAIKPAHEPICMSRRPLIGTILSNVTKYGTGALNIDACRVGTEPAFVNRRGEKSSGGIMNHTGEYHVTSGGPGRWPANVILDEEAARDLDEQSGVLTSGKMKAGTIRAGQKGFLEQGPHVVKVDTYGDTGGASRYFYTAKPDVAEREAGLSGFDGRQVNDGRQSPVDNAFQRGETQRRNTHTTVKPISLMRYLCRLVTPPGGTILDPFAGSGTTGFAALAENFSCILIEKEAEYFEIIRARLRHAALEDGLFTQKDTD